MLRPLCSFFMANPQPDKFTKIANELLEVLPLVKWTVAERAILDVVIRKTYGYNKKMDWISNSQFVSCTGMYKQHTSTTVRRLLNKKVLCKDGKKIGIQKDYEQWKVEWRLSYTDVTPSYTDVTFVIYRGTTKDIDNIQKTSTEQSSEELKDNQNDMPFRQYESEDAYMDRDVQIEPDYKPEKLKKKKVSDEVQSVFDLFTSPAKATWYLRPLERESAKVLLETYGFDTLKKRVDRIESEKKKNAGDPYFPLVTTPSQLLDKMEAVERYLGV